MAGNEKKADISMTGNKSGKPSIDGKTLKRLMSYIVGRHKLTFFMVVVCILISSCTVVVSSLFLQILIDNYITPMLSEVNPSFAPLLKTIIMLGCLYLVGVLSTFAYNKMMIKISQGTLKAIRDDMFTHMQTLPIRYFDTHTHGDVMSHYTNDTDTLRQFISQALPQFISAVVTIVVVIVSMIVNSIPLTILVLAVTCIMQIVSKKIGGASARYFIRQQITIGKVTGFIEEMINGQKVIKVFCHEDEAKYDFDKNNEMLCSDATNANKYGNILMPAISQLGNLQYVLIALIGGFLALRGIGGITVGMIVAFLNLSKTFCMPVSQIAQQISMIAMALAGAERIFGLIDEKPEEDEGDVTLVRVKCDDKELNNKEADNIFDMFASSKDYRDSIDIVDNSLIPRSYVLYIDVADEAGAIATIATILATEKVSIKNIGIIHNREFEEGVLRIEFYDEDSAANASKLLQKYRYVIYEV